MPLAAHSVPSPKARSRNLSLSGSGLAPSIDERSAMYKPLGQGTLFCLIGRADLSEDPPMSGYERLRKAKRGSAVEPELGDISDPAEATKTFVSTTTLTAGPLPAGFVSDLLTARTRCRSCWRLPIESCHIRWRRRGAIEKQALRSARCKIRYEGGFAKPCRTPHNRRKTPARCLQTAISETAGDYTLLGGSFLALHAHLLRTSDLPRDYVLVEDSLRSRNICR